MYCLQTPVAAGRYPGPRVRNGDQGAYQDLPVTRFLSQCTRWDWDLNLALVTPRADLGSPGDPPQLRSLPGSQAFPPPPVRPSPKYQEAFSPPCSRMCSIASFFPYTLNRHPVCQTLCERQTGQRPQNTFLFLLIKLIEPLRVQARPGILLWSEPLGCRTGPAPRARQACNSPQTA